MTMAHWYLELAVIFLSVAVILLRFDGCASLTAPHRPVQPRSRPRPRTVPIRGEGSAFEWTTVVWPLLASVPNVNDQADVCSTASHRRHHERANDHQVVEHHHAVDRRDVFRGSTLALGALAVSVVSTDSANAFDLPFVATDRSSASSFTPAIRPTSYRVDSTIPPTLLPVPTARAQLAVLKDLGRGLGTDKKAVFIDTLNLNNMLQKAVYGTADAIANLGKGTSNTQAPASFVCFGLPTQLSARDIDLTVSLLESMWGPISMQSVNNRAIGMANVPYTVQGTLNDFVAGRVTLTEVRDLLVEQQAVSPESWPMVTPLFQFAARAKIALLALGVAPTDRVSVLKNGLQSVDPESRSFYVVDPEGFIATTTDPAFKLYTDRSLLKDLESSTASTGNYFAERILVHEAAATIAARFALEQGGGPGTVVAIVAPAPDLRYLGGINGRLPRVYQRLATTSNGAAVALAAELQVTPNDITTILINPTAPDTLSRTVRLRLEIGTGPETLPYQTKIADYLWFSSSPAVSLLPRVMDYRY